MADAVAHNANMSRSMVDNIIGGALASACAQYSRCRSSNQSGASSSQAVGCGSFSLIGCLDPLIIFSLLGFGFLPRMVSPSVGGIATVYFISKFPANLEYLP